MSAHSLVAVISEDDQIQVLSLAAAQALELVGGWWIMGPAVGRWGV